MGNINIEHMIDIQTKYLLFLKWITIYVVLVFFVYEATKKWKNENIKKNSFKEHNFIENADIKHCEKL